MSFARCETTPRYSKRSPMVLISASDSSSENTLMYVFRNPAERVGEERENPVNHSATGNRVSDTHTHRHTHTHTHTHTII